MKVKSIVASLALVAGAVLFVAPTAYAGECSAEDPCQTYAMVDSSGIVTNIIVCQPSVCGSGTFAGSRVVPQVAASPEGQNQGGYLANPGSTPVRESNGVFTITNDNTTRDVSVVNNGATSTHLATEFEAGLTNTFTFNDTVGQPNGRPIMRPGIIDNSVGAKLSVTELSNSETPTVLSEEVAVFEERKTEQFVELTLQLNNLNKILANWTRFKLSLMNWFL